MKASVKITWVDATKKQPTSMEEVLIVTRRNRVCLGHWNGSRQLWYEYDDFSEIPVSYWAIKPLSPDYL